MNEHFGAIEADFQAHYGLDLREVLWGSNSYGVRRITSLIQGLPPRGMLARSLNARGMDWSTTDELLASVIELIDMTNRLLYSAYSKKGSQTWKPIVVNRPTETQKELKPASPSEMRKFFRGSAKYTPGGEKS